MQNYFSWKLSLKLINYFCCFYRFLFLDNPSDPALGTGTFFTIYSLIGAVVFLILGWLMINYANRKTIILLNVILLILIWGHLSGIFLRFTMQPN